jgi:type I restriction enzyme S subunit
MSINNQHKPGYKHTPLGWIPEQWEISDFERMCSALVRGPFGGALKKEIFTNTGYKVYEQRNAIYKDCLLGSYFIDKEKFNELKRFSVEPGNFLVSCSGTIGKIYKVPSDAPKGVINQALLKIVCDDKKVEPEFFNHYFEWDGFQKRIIDNSQGGAMQNLVGMELFRQVPCSLPPLSEQHKIAAILSTWDEAITKTQQLIAQLQQRNKGLMQHLLTAKDNWKEYRIGELLKEVKRPVKWSDEELYHLISVRRRSGGAFFRESLYGKQILTKQLFTAEEGDFLISKMQIVHGASAVVPKEFAGMKISGSYIAVHAKDEKVLDINFFNWLSKTRWFYRLTYVSSYGVHIEKMTFDFDDFKRRKIMLPPTVEERRRIVKVLQTASEEIKLYEQKLAALQQQKKGLMQKLLTGEIRLKIDHNQNS